MRQITNIKNHASYNACVQLGRAVRMLCDTSAFVSAALELAHGGRLNSGAYGRKSTRISQVINQLHDVGLVVWVDYRYRKINVELIGLVRECGEVLGVVLDADDQLRFARNDIERVRAVFDLLSREQCWVMLERGYGETVPRSEFIGECASAQVSLYFAKLRKVGLITKSSSKLYTTNRTLLETLTIIAGRALNRVESARGAIRPIAVRDKRALTTEVRAQRREQLAKLVAEGWRMIHEEGATCYRIEHELGLSQWQMRRHGFPVVGGRGKYGKPIVLLKDGVKHEFSSLSAAARFVGRTQSHLSNVLAGRCKLEGYEVVGASDKITSQQ